MFDTTLSGVNIYLRKADLEINSNKTFPYTKLLTTKVNYEYNDKKRPICKGKCQDTCSGDSGEGR